MSETVEAKIKANLAQRVTLNVGGSKFQTTVYTVTRYPESLLYAMFKGTFPVEPDENGEYFIDRDGTNFGYVLNYLREGDLDFPHNELQLRQIEREARYYGLPELENACSEFRRTLQASHIVQQHMSYVDSGYSTSLPEAEKSGEDASGDDASSAGASKFGAGFSFGSGSGFGLAPSGSGFGLIAPSGSGFGMLAPSGSGFGMSGSGFGMSGSGFGLTGAFGSSTMFAGSSSSVSEYKGVAYIAPGGYHASQTTEEAPSSDAQAETEGGEPTKSEPIAAEPGQRLFNPKYEGTEGDMFEPIDPYSAPAKAKETEQKSKEEPTKDKPKGF